MLEMFENRLRKNAKHLGKWAKRRQISCYRLYDRDIPEFPFVVDYYEGKIHLQAMSRTDELDAARDAVCAALELPPSSVKTKSREGQKDHQYEKTGKMGEDFVVSEGGHKFIVNLDAYLDTGLFLDHRNTRMMIGERAKGRRFLNLFSYTGSFTVYAAKGGAEHSISVDLSNTYLDWARENLVLNGIDTNKNSLIRSDVKVFLEESKRQGGRFDLIVLDPPSFSNSKKMEGTLDIQRDHVSLVNLCLELLTPGGELFFSNNLRSFKLDLDAFRNIEYQEISNLTVPEDFRNKKIHRSWLFKP